MIELLFDTELPLLLLLLFFLFLFPMLGSLMFFPLSLIQ